MQKSGNELLNDLCELQKGIRELTLLPKLMYRLLKETMMMNDDDINEQMLQLSEEEDDPDEAEELESDLKTLIQTTFLI